MEEMKNHVEEAPQMTEEEQTQMANEALVNMLSQIFSKEKIEEFLKSLTDEQNMYVAAFVTGFRTHLRYATGKEDADIVGVFSHEYVEEKKLPKEILDLIALRSYNINVTPLDLSFDVFWQDVPTQPVEAILPDEERPENIG